MAVYRVEGPDGKVYRIEGPDGASDDQVLTQAKALFENAATNTVVNTHGQKRGVLASLGAGLKQGVGSVAGAINEYGSAATDAVGISDNRQSRIAQENEQTRAKFESETQGSTAAKIGNVAGQIAATLPLGGAPGLALRGAGAALGAANVARAGQVLAAQGAIGTLPQRMAAGAVSGAAVAPIVNTANGEDASIESAAGAGVVGAAVPAVLAGAGRAIRGLGSKEASSANQGANQGAIPSPNQGAQSFGPANNRSVASGVKPSVPVDENAKLIQDALRRKSDFEAVGVNQPLGPMLTRDAEEWRRMKELSKLDDVGRPIVAKFAEVDGALKTKLGEIAQPVFAGDGGKAVIDSLERIASQKKAAADGLYIAARNNADKSLSVDLEPLRRFSLDMKPSWQVTPEYSIAAKWIKQNGKELADGTNAGFTVERVEDLRKTLNAARNPANPASSRAIADLIDRLDEAVGSVGGGKVFAGARSAFQQLKAITADQGIVEDLLKKTSKVDRKVAYEDVLNKIIKGDVASLKQVKNTLVVGGETNAWEKLRGQSIQHLLDKAFPVGGSGQFMAAAYQRELKALSPEKMAVLFTPAENDMLQRIARVGSAARSDVSDSFVNHSNSSANFINYLQKASALPVAGNFVAPIAAVAKATSAARESGRRQNELAQMLQGNVISKSQSKDAAKRQSKEARARLANLLQRIPASSAIAPVDQYQN
jgi:hypothetical protein